VNPNLGFAHCCSERVEINADILAVGSGALVPTGPGKAVAAASATQEADGVEGSRKKVVPGVMAGVTADDYIPPDYSIGEVSGERGVPHADSRSDHPILVVQRNVVCITKTVVPALRGDDVTALKRGIVVDDNVLCFLDHLKQPPPATPLGSADIIKEIVLNQDPLRLPARMVVVSAKNIDARGSVTHDIMDKGHIFDHGPRRAPVLVADCKQNSKTALCVCPVVLEEIALNEDSTSIFQLEEVFYRPRNSLIGRVSYPPRREWLDRHRRT